ncbi:MAG: hypothetical protein ABL886_10000 [Rhodoglobus sp.]
MTVDIPTRAPEYPPQSDDRRGRRGGSAPKPGRSRSVGKAPLVVGGQPRANLLPPEIILKRKQLKTRRALRAGVLLVAVATAAGCVLTFGVASVAQVQFGLAQQTQQALVLEQSEYQEVSDVQDTINTIVAGQQVGGSTEINWRSYLLLLEATLPAGVVLDTVKIESGTPMAAFIQSNAPLQGARVAALSFTVNSPTLPSIPDWLRSMADLPGFVDAIPGNVKGAEGSYAVDVVLHVNAEAFSMRFDPEHVAAAEAKAEAAAAAAAAGLSAVTKSLVAVVPAATDETTDGAADEGATDGEGN